MENCELTILMPCLNEAETLARCIHKAQQFLVTARIEGEILIADNGSTDGSQAIANTAGARVITVPLRGYGAALKHGIRAAHGRYIIMGDADDSYNFSALFPFLKKLREGYDLVMGNRFKGGIKQGAMPFLNRYVGNPILSFIGRLFFNSQIGDFHCGLRGFSRARLLQLNLQGNGMEFASEMVIKAELNRFKITEVPTELFPDGRSRPPHLRRFRDGWRHLRLLLLFSPRWLFFYPGLVLMWVGIVAMVVLQTGPLTIGRVSLDIHTMLFSSLFTIIGLQAVCFAVCAKYFLIHQVYTESRYQRLVKIFSLERGLLVGLSCMTIGIAGSGYVFWFWLNHSFGPLAPQQVMRLLIPSFTFLIAGLQLIFASFFLSLLSLRLDPQRKLTPS
ncbi:MAG: glycosyltransferase family 2 protein [Gammaproteobacteria bacterium]|nr:glycosyltransferase family 2 protein [Gammaproteobacteria bacterium]